MKFNPFSKEFLLFFAIILGLACGFSNSEVILKIAETFSTIFINLLKLISAPVIFLSVVSTLLSFDNMKDIRTLGGKVLKYTLLTTLIAAALSLSLFLLIQPVGQQITAPAQHVLLEGAELGYLDHLINIIPTSIVEPFINGNVIGVLFLALLLSYSVLQLPNENKKVLQKLFSSLYMAVMHVTKVILVLMPFAIWAFITLFVKEVSQGMEVKTLGLYLLCIVLANIIQATIILPIFLLSKGISPIKMFKGMFPALSIAFFSKSSSAALPSAIECARDRLSISKKVANFSFPLCTTINMNACAAFILITVLFVSMSHGVTYTWFDLIMWIFLATIAAIGNAGVPMGCYFLASAFLASMNVPLSILGVILPFYSLIDMLESAINVWSDSCVTAVVDKELASEELIDEEVVVSDSQVVVS